MEIIAVDGKFKKMVDNVKNNVNSKYKSPVDRRPPLSNTKITKFLVNEINPKELEKKLINFFKLH